MHCLLHGCEGESSDNKATQVFVDAALDKTCVAQVMNRLASWLTRGNTFLVHIRIMEDLSVVGTVCV